MKHILITGGAGFIGTNLAKKLCSRGDRVVLLDNLWTGKFKNVLEIFEKYKTLSFHYHDVEENFSNVKFSWKEFDEIYHLASPASPPKYQAKPIKTMKTNVMGTINAMEFAVRNEAKILLASTSEVYGDPLEHPQKESYRGWVSTTGPRGCYDEAKRAAEAVAFDFQRKHDADIRVARIFNTMGPYMDPEDGRVVTNFIHQALKGEPLTIYGDGSQTRSLCYVDDMTDGLIGLMESGYSEGPVNIGNPDEVSVFEIGREVSEIVGVDFNPSFHPLPQDDPKQRCPDTTLISEVMGWSPKVSRYEGLKRTAEFFSERFEKSPTGGK